MTRKLAVSEQELSGLQETCKRVCKGHLEEQGKKLRPSEIQIATTQLEAFLQSTFFKVFENVHEITKKEKVIEGPEDMALKERCEVLQKEVAEKMELLTKYRRELPSQLEPSDDEVEEEPPIPTEVLETALGALDPIHFDRIRDLQAASLQELEELKATCPVQRTELRTLTQYFQKNEGRLALTPNAHVAAPAPPLFPFISSASANTHLQTTFWLPPTQVLAALPGAREPPSSPPAASCSSSCSCSSSSSSSSSSSCSSTSSSSSSSSCCSFSASTVPDAHSSSSLSCPSSSSSSSSSASSSSSLPPVSFFFEPPSSSCIVNDDSHPAARPDDSGQPSGDSLVQPHSSAAQPALPSTNDFLVGDSPTNNNNENGTASPATSSQGGSSLPSSAAAVAKDQAYSSVVGSVVADVVVADVGAGDDLLEALNGDSLGPSILLG